MAEDRSQNIDAFGRQELGWVVPQVLDSSRTVTGMTDSKEDTGEITWQRPDGTAYTLNDGADGTVHNSEMYVAKLPGRQLLDPAAFDTGDTASQVAPVVVGLRQRLRLHALGGSQLRPVDPRAGHPAGRLHGQPAASSPTGTSSGTSTTATC